jgi:adenylate cyclase class IV
MSLLFWDINTSSQTPTIEIELKYEILDINLLNPFLETLEYQKTQSTHDVYFDTPEGTYFKKGLWIRNRNNKTLDFKFNRAGLLDQSKPMTAFCEEHSFQLPLEACDRERLIALCDFLQLQVPDYLNLPAFTKLNGIQEMAIVNKTRNVYQHHAFKIMIDTIENVGHFLEIELMAFDSDNVLEITKEMEDMLEGLPLKRTTITYDAAWWKIHHFDIYQQGRYIRSIS